MVPTNMTQTEQTDPRRWTDELRLEEASVEDRIEPILIPRIHEFDVGDRVHDQSTRPLNGDETDDRTFDVRLVAHGYNGSWQDVQNALVYDPESNLFARLSGHTSSGAMNQLERDYKIRELGQDIAVVDQWDVDIPDLNEFGESEEEFVAEWVDILFDNIRHGEQPGDEIDQFEGKTFQLRDYDNRYATIKYELTDETS